MTQVSTVVWSLILRQTSESAKSSGTQEADYEQS